MSGGVRPDDRLTDRVAIAELRARYNHHYDAGEIDAFVALFADDAEAEMGPGTIVQGVDLIRRHAEEAWSFTADENDFVRHFCDLGITDFDDADPDRATGRSHVLLHLGRAFTVLGGGTYHDRYRRIDGEWKFASRRVEFEYFGDPGDVTWPPRPGSRSR